MSITEKNNKEIEAVKFAESLEKKVSEILKRLEDPNNLTETIKWARRRISDWKINEKIKDLNDQVYAIKELGKGLGQENINSHANEAKNRIEEKMIKIGKIIRKPNGS